MRDCRHCPGGRGAASEDNAEHCSYHRGAKLTPELRRAFERLPEHEQWVVRLRCGLDSDECLPRSLTEVGEIAGPSSQRVRQIEARLLELIRHLGLAS